MTDRVGVGVDVCDGVSVVVDVVDPLGVSVGLGVDDELGVSVELGELDGVCVTVRVGVRLCVSEGVWLTLAL